MEFTEGIKNWFFRRGSQVDLDSRVCLLDANGNVIGSNKVMEMLSLPYKSDIGDAFVDLGLPSGRLWASRNLGATSDTDAGWYASWGNMLPHAYGDEYVFNASSYEVTKAYGINDNLSFENDVIHAFYGGVCRLPTKADFEELINPDYTSISFEESIGDGGFLITSNANNNWIFIPAAGQWMVRNIRRQGTDCFMWTSELDKGVVALDKAYCYHCISSLNINSVSTTSRYYGHSVRAVI